MTSLLTTASSGQPIHRTRSWKLRWLAPVVVSGTLLVGGAASAQESTPAPATPTDATPAPDAPRIELEFTELNDSGATGTATLTEEGDKTLVQLKMEGTGENHPTHIHKGTCDDIEAVPAYNLENVGKEGTSSTLVDVPLQELIDGDYIIDLHLAPNQLGTLIDCANIEGTPTAPGVGGEGTPTATAGATEAATETATEATATETATSQSVAAPTQTPTTAPTETATAEPTEAPTQEPTATATETPKAVGGVSTTTSGDGTTADTTTSGVTNPAVSGKGVPVGGGDGTDGQASSLSATGGTGDLPSATGSGSSLLGAHTPRDAALQAMAAFSAILLLAGVVLRRGESHRLAGKPARFRRLGL